MYLLRKKTHNEFRMFHSYLHFIRVNIDIQSRCIHVEMKHAERKTMHHKKGFVAFFNALGNFFGFDISGINVIVFIIAIGSCDGRSSEIPFNPNSAFVNQNRDQLIGSGFSVDSVNHFFQISVSVRHKL